MFFENVYNNEIFLNKKNSKLQAHIKQINFSLTSVTSRKNGLKQLLLLHTQCNDETRMANWEKWLNLCFKIIESSDDIELKCALAVVHYILSCSDNSRFKNSLMKFNFNLLVKLFTVKSQFSEDACKSLYQAVRHFPAQLLPLKGRIENFLMKCMSNPIQNDVDISHAAKTFAALPVPGGTNGDVLHETRLNQIVSLCHCLCDVIYVNVDEHEKYDFSRDHKLPISIVDEANENRNPINSMLNAVPILFNGLQFISAFLTHSNMRFVNVVPKELLQLSFRILQVERDHISESKGLDAKKLKSILSSIHLEALRFLHRLVVSGVCGYFLNLVVEQAVATLKSWQKATRQEKNESNGTTNSFSAVRVECFKILSRVVKVSSGNFSTCLNVIIPVVLRIITPVQSKLLLNSDVRGGRLTLISAKKRSKKKPYTAVAVSNADKENLSDDDELSEAGNNDARVTVAALEYVKTLFLCAHHSVDIKLIRSLMLQLTMLSQMNDITILSNIQVRKSLYDAIIAYALHPNPLYPPNYAELVKILSQGEKHSNAEVSLICSLGLAAVNFPVSNPSVLAISDILRLNDIAAPQQNFNEYDVDELNVEKEIASDDINRNVVSLDRENDATFNHLNSDDDEIFNDVKDSVNDKEIHISENKQKNSENENLCNDNIHNKSPDKIEDISRVDVKNLSDEYPLNSENNDAEEILQDEDVSSTFNDEINTNKLFTVSNKPPKKDKTPKTKNQLKRKTSNEEIKGKRNKKKESDFVSVSEMIASFVVSDPDPL